MSELDEQIEAELPAGQTLDYDKLGAAIGGAVAAGIAATTRRKVSNGEYEQKWKAGRKRLIPTVFQNSFPLATENLQNDVVDLLNKINRSGRYCNRLVEVIYTLDGGTQPVVLLRYNNQTPDQRFEMRGYIRNFKDMIQQIVDEQAVENERDENQRAAIEELQRGKSRNHFGKGKKDAD